MRKLKYFILFICTSYIMYGQRISPPYFQDFENCANVQEWQKGSSGLISVSTCGQIGITSCCTGPTSGVGFAKLDMDLSYVSSLTMEFKWMWTPYSKTYSSCWDDTYANSISGVFISDDNGATYQKIFNFDVRPNYTWQYVTLDLSNLAAQYGIQLNDQVVLKFQMFSIYAQGGLCMRDIYIDDINIYERCDLNYSFSNTSALNNYPRLNGYYEVSNNITAGPNVSILPYTNVTFNAGVNINLNMGFHANRYSNFKAYLSGCNFLLSADNANFSKEYSKTSEDLMFVLYPNPTNGKLNIELQEKPDGKYLIFNSTGQVIKQNILKEKLTTVDMTGNHQGLYIIKIVTSEGTSTQRFILK